MSSPTPAGPPDSAFPVNVLILTLAIGIAAATAILGFAGSSLSSTLDCPALLSCSAAAAADHLPPATPDREPVQAAVDSGFRTLVRVVLGLTSVLIALVGLNLATRALTDAASSHADTTLRAALGAPPLRLFLERAGAALRVATPAVVLGSGVGLLGQWWLQESWPGATAPWEPVAALPAATLLVGVALVIVLFVTLCWPAGFAWRRDLRSHLGDGEHSTPGPLDALVKDSLAMAQAGASVLLLVVAGLLVLGFPGSRGPSAAGAGYDDGPGTLLMEIELPTESPGSSDLSARALRYAALLERVRGLPGVVDTSLASEGAWLGLGVTERITSLCLECWLGLLPKVQTTGPARIHSVGPDYFRIAGVGILRGREFDAEDAVAAERVAIISQGLALRFFPNGDALGKEVRLGALDGPWFRVVGVVEDLEAEGLGTPSLPEPALYLSVLQLPPASATLLARTRQGPPALAGRMEGLAREVLPRARVSERGRLSTAREAYRAPLRWFGWIFAVLSAGTLVCACAGLYDLISAHVRLRTREIGIRMAVGAEERTIVRMVGARTLRLVGIGSVLALIPLGGVARMLQLRFQGVDPWDPALLLSVIALLLGVALFAGHRPARHAARVEPVEALRGG